jgi:cytidylate kinase
MEKFIITISREYGSGGRYVGEQLAKEFGIPFYDKEIIHMVAERSGLSAGFIEKSDENLPNTFLHNLKYSAYSTYDSISFYDTPVTDKVFLAQSAVIKELASQGSCVIVGRCADYILRDEPGLVTVFIRGSIEDRVSRAVEHYGLPSEKAAEKLRKIDKSRTNYYKYYTNRQWGSIDNFDLAINTSFTGVDVAVAIIATMLREKSGE